MKEDARRQNVNWRKIIWVSLILLVVGYIYAQPQLEQWLGFKLPNLADAPVADVENQQTKRPASPSQFDNSNPIDKTTSFKPFNLHDTFRLQAQTPGAKPLRFSGGSLLQHGTRSGTPTGPYHATLPRRRVSPRSRSFPGRPRTDLGNH